MGCGQRCCQLQQTEYDPSSNAYVGAFTNLPVLASAPSSDKYGMSFYQREHQKKQLDSEGQVGELHSLPRSIQTKRHDFNCLVVPNNEADPSYFLCALYLLFVPAYKMLACRMAPCQGGWHFDKQCRLEVLPKRDCHDAVEAEI
jgi:hypothetical protein